MIINIMSAIIATTTGYAVFSHRVNDGLLAKHGLIFASVLSSLSMLDSHLVLSPESSAIHN